MEAKPVAKSPEISIGPPHAGPLVCFYCAVGACGHSPSVRRSEVHGGGLIPAITMLQGTVLCLDCASERS